MENTHLTDDRQLHQKRQNAFLTHLTFYLICNAAMALWDLTFTERFSLRVYPVVGWGIAVLFHGVLIAMHAPNIDLQTRLLDAISHSSTAKYPRLRRLTIDLGFNIVFCTVGALIVTYMMRVGTSFYVNLVFSLCIGTIALLMIDGGRLLLWNEQRPNKIGLLALLGLSIPTARYLGNHIATRILGIPYENFLTTRSQHTAGFLILTVLSFSIFTWFFWSRGTMEHLKAEAEAEKSRAAAIEKQALQAQLQMLQAQIEPHMLFNTLANLQGLIAIDPPRAQHMLEQLIHYLRSTLSASRSAQSTLTQEFSLLRAYLELMSIRMGSRLGYALELPDELASACIPPMLLQPLVENSIKHGLEPKIDGGRIDVCASKSGNQLVLTVTDTGLGEDAPKAGPNQPGLHVGLANIRERLHALYGEQATFALTPNHPCGMIARITLPLV